jgi:hypothetical protein
MVPSKPDAKVSKGPILLILGRNQNFLPKERKGEMDFCLL